MKRALVLVLVSAFALPLPAQESAPAQQSAPAPQTAAAPPPAPAPQPATSQTIQMECRDLASSNEPVGPDETVINGKACRQVSAPAKIAEPVAIPPAQAEPASAATPAAASLPQVPKDAAAPVAILLEDGTPIHLVLSENLSSASATTGETVEFEVVDDIVVNGLLVVPHGSTAWATVTEAEHKRHLGRGGKLDLNIDKVRLADGEKALLRGVKDTQGGGHTGAMTGAMVATAIVIWPVAPLFLFMHGKDINIPKGTQITAFVQGDVHLDANKFQKQLAVSR
jgi:hypothetical protein